MNRIDRLIYQQRASFYFPRLTPYIERGSSIVDIGAGDGLLARLISEKLECKSLAFEVSSAQSGGENDVRVFNGCDIPLPDGSVDISLSLSVIHHAEYPERLLREIGRITGKRFLLVEDHYESLLDRFMTWAIHFYLEKVVSMPFNRTGFSNVAGWEKRLNDAGFRVVEVRPLGLTFFLVFPSRSVLLVCEKMKEGAR